METLRNGIPRVISSVPQEDHATENTVAVVASGGKIPWYLKFWAKIGPHRAFLGAVRTFAGRDDRVVAFLSCPGAQYFEVEGRGNSPTTQDELGIHLEGMESRGGPWGVQPILGNSVDGARSYRVVTGVAGAVTVTGEVWGWAAWAAGAGATVAVAAGPALSFGPVGVPTGGSVRGDARGVLAPVSTWTFVGTSGYLVEYVPPGGDFDG